MLVKPLSNAAFVTLIPRDEIRSMALFILSLRTYSGKLMFRRTFISFDNSDWLMPIAFAALSSVIFSVKCLPM